MLDDLKLKIVDSLESTKDTLSSISTMPIATTKIAITGLSRAGKTVFITSLIDQLLHQQKIPSVTEKHKVFKTTLKPSKASIKRFDYYSLAKDIKLHAKWPMGTDTITSTILEFEKKGRFAFLKNSKFRIELIDYPGEWILDIALLELNYDEWVNKVIDWMKNIDEPLATAYIDKIDKLADDSSGEILEIELHNEYSNMIRYFKDNHYSQLTPGRFLMPSDLIDDPMLCFAPINKKNMPIYKVFKKRYKAYLEEVVHDIHLNHFKEFDRQIVLVDIVEALQNGSKCYIDMKGGIKTMLSFYNHKSKNFFLKWFSSSIDKVTFIATKADLVTSSQHNNYLSLLNEMLEDIQKELDINHIQTDTQVISSVKCTQTISKKLNNKILSCIRGIDATTKKIVEIYSGEMPSKFPPIEKWDVNDYQYEEFLPSDKNYKDTEPFDHIHMDRVVESIIGDLL